MILQGQNTAFLSVGPVASNFENHRWCRNLSALPRPRSRALTVCILGSKSKREGKLQQTSQGALNEKNHESLLIKLSTLLSIIVGLAILLARSEMRFDEIDRKLSKHGTQFALIHKNFESFDEKFKSVDKKFEGIDQRLDSLDKRFEGIDKKFITDRFENLDKRFEGIDKKFIIEKFEKIDLQFKDIEKEIKENSKGLEKTRELIKDELIMEMRRKKSWPWS